MAKVKLDIESDYGPVEQAFRKIGSDVDSTKNKFGDLSSSAKKAFIEAGKRAKEMGDGLKKSDESLKTSIQKYKEAPGIIGKLIEKEKQLIEARNKSNSEKLIKQYNRLLDETRSKLNSLNKVQKEVAKPGLFDNLKSGILSVFGGNLLFSAVSKIKQAFTQIFTNNIKLEKSIKNLSAITGASGKDLAFYGEEANKMGKKIEGGAVAAVEAFKLIGSAKPELLKNKEALVEVTKAAVTLAQASGLTLPEAAKNLGAALNAFGAPAQDAGKFINVMAAAAQLGAQEIPFVTDALSKFGGVAKQAGVSIEESAAAIEILGAKIPEASIVGTNLRGVLIKLQVVAGAEKREFEGLGKELDRLAPKVKDVTFLKSKFGDENLLAIQTLIAEREALGKLTTGVTGTSSAYEQAATNTDTMAQATLEATNAIDLFITAIGNSSLVQNTAKNSVKAYTESLTQLTEVLEGKFFSAENISRRELAKLKDEFVNGKISAKEYASQLSLFLRINPKIAKSINEIATGANGEGGITETVGLIEELQAKITELTNLRAKATNIKDIFSFNDQIKATQKQLDDLLGKTSKDILKIQEEYDKAFAELRKKSNAERVKELSGEEKVELERQFALQEIQIEEDKFIKLGLALDKHFKLTTEQQNIFNSLRLGAERKAADDLISLELEKQKTLLDIQKKTNQLNLENLDIQEQEAINAVTSTPNRGVNKVVFEQAQQRQILDIQKRFAIERINLKKQELASEYELDKKALETQLSLIGTGQDSITQSKRDAIKKQLDLIEYEYSLSNKKLVAETDKTIDEINKKRDTLNEEQTFLSRYDRETQATQQFLNELQGAFDSYYNSKQSLIDDELNDLEKIQNERERNIEKLKDQLQREYDLQEEGKANNINRINDEIQQQEELRKKDLQEEKRIKAEKKKLAEEQFVIDTLVQASNLAVAATQIYATVAKDPYTTALATATVATMIVAFAAQKAAAYKEIQKKLKDGEIGIEGPGTETSDSIPAMLSKGESVVSAKKTRQNRTLLEGIHEDDKKKMHVGILDLIRGQGIRLENDLPELLLSKKQSIKNAEVNAMLMVDNSKLENELAEVKHILNLILAENKSRIYSDVNGNVVYKNGSNIVVTRKS